MARALELAWLGAGRTRTNPLVGAVVAREGRIVGEGYHALYGREHAETAALDQAGDLAVGATLYVTLEPCTHQGKTPPCTSRIIRSRVMRVVISILDPDPRMSGRGIRQLRDAGIQVDIGCHADRAVALNLPYLKQLLGLGPSVTLKMAITMDGRITSREGVRDRVTGDEAGIVVHRLRATRSAALVGINTVLVDAPRLDTRLIEGAETPVPVVVDSRLRTPADYHWMRDGRSPVVLTGKPDRGAAAATLEAAGARVVECEVTQSGVTPVEAVAALESLGLGSVLVEGGAGVFSSFLEEGLWDDMHLFVAPHTFGAEGVALTGRRLDTRLVGAVPVDAEPVGMDVHITYLNRRTREEIVRRLT